MDIFLSYCWKDDEIANKIYDYFKKNHSITLHRDKIDIKNWGSIKEYMQSLNDMEYIILIISENYLKSSNCMYEVLETIRDRKYRNKIFPVVLDKGIYNPINKAKYVRYWENEFNELKNAIDGINTQNLGNLSNDLKHYQNIASNISDFIDTVADMNNPLVDGIEEAIEQVLYDREILVAKKDDNKCEKSVNILPIVSSEPTDLEIDTYVNQCYKSGRILLKQKCHEIEKNNPMIKVKIEDVDTRNTIYHFYKNGQTTRKIKYSLGSMFGGNDSIMISNNPISSNSYNGMYQVQYRDGKIGLKTMMGFGSNGLMSVEEMVEQIWKEYIELYLRY